MNSLSQSQEPYRSPRTRPDSLTHAVLRFPDGRQSRGELRVYSVTGGLLSLPRPIDHGSRVKLMFMTPTGAVQGAAEMLDAISWGLQPFRFVALTGPDQRRLRDAIESSLRKNLTGDAWIERYRAMSNAVPPPRKAIRRLLFAALLLATILGCSSVIYYHALLK